MNTKEIREELAGANENALTADGFDEALIGYAEGWIPAEGGGCTQGTVALYDREKCVEILVKRDEMTRDEAEEFLSFNITGAYMGPFTPMFATILRKP